MKTQERITTGCMKCGSKSDIAHYAGCPEIGERMIGISEKLRCPKCGFESSEFLEVRIPEYKGNYCINCWAKWISENIQRLN